MADVWLLWFNDSHGTSLLGIYVTQHAAEAAAEAKINDLRGYHGPRYPLQVTQRLGENSIATQYSEQIWWKTAPVLT